MIQLGSIYEICLCIISVTGMDQPACVSYAASNDTCTVMETLTQPNLPLAIGSKISTVSCDSATWHTDYYKQDASARSCKIFQTLYLCLTSEL